MKKILIVGFFIFCSINNFAISKEEKTLQEEVHSFLKNELSKISGEKTINVTNINMEKFPLNECKNLNFFIPKGTRLIGKTTIATNCKDENHTDKRNVFIPVEISIKDKYFVSNKKINAGQIIKEEDIEEIFDNVGFFPEQLISDKKNILGKKLTQQIRERQPFKNNMIDLPIVIQYNQEIHITHGSGNYKVSARGKSMGVAKLGQEVKLKMPNGKVLTGIAQDDGSVKLKEKSE